jgi:hypothetical protein
MIGVRRESDPAADTGEFVCSDENGNRKSVKKTRTESRSERIDVERLLRHSVCDMAKDTEGGPTGLVVNSISSLDAGRNCA